MNDTDRPEAGAGGTIKTITKSTTISVALAITLLTGAYHAGQQKQRLDSLESAQTETTEVLSQLRKLSETMDKRLTLLEELNARKERKQYQREYGAERERTGTGTTQPVAHHARRGAGGPDSGAGRLRLPKPLMDPIQGRVSSRGIDSGQRQVFPPEETGR